MPLPCQLCKCLFPLPLLWYNKLINSTTVFKLSFHTFFCNYEISGWSTKRFVWWFWASPLLSELHHQKQRFPKAKDFKKIAVISMRFLEYFEILQVLMKTIKILWIRVLNCLLLKEFAIEFLLRMRCVFSLLSLRLWGAFFV